MTTRFLAAASEQGASTTVNRTRVFLKALVGAVLASAAMFHGPAFSADPNPLKVGVRGGVRFHQAIASASAGSDSTCLTGSFVSFRNRPTRSLRSHPDFVPGNVETMSSSVRSS